MKSVQCFNKIFSLIKFVFAIGLGGSLSLALVTPAFAQQEPQFTASHYISASFNPAAVGLMNGLQLGFTGRSQWVGIEGQPASALLMAQAPIPQLMSALGVNVMSDRIGVFTATSLKLNYAFSLPLGKKGNVLQLGLAPMFLFRNMDASQFTSIYETPPNPLITQLLGRQINANAFDIGIGALVAKKAISYPLLGPQYYLGGGIDHLLQPTLAELGAAFTLGRTFYLQAGYRYDFSESFISLLPALHYKRVGNQNQLDLQLDWAYRPLLIGVGYRGASNADALLTKVGFMLNRFLFLYSYDYTLSALTAATSGSHEITLTYFIDFKNQTAQKRKNKTVPDLDVKDFPQLSK
jgi:type IX secretion system PorP/SprF family membrane protein